ncbi:carbonic anhydrase 15-like [Brienomyrus brachyistius]|uniref:carbonic anhydrase 15-like n=1 Tax=Brienomyrus brachyistius TaxID=42636 RepID=UPI0020B3C58E|nr:carbonic anhydrase 15-like [Brienomyrus brachyistius]
MTDKIYSTSTLEFMFFLVHIAGPSRSEDTISGDSWCYQGCDKDASNWATLVPSECGGSKQSPININTSVLTPDSQLRAFTFTNFSNPHSITGLINTGHTVRCTLEKNTVEVKGGGLKYSYSATEIHFHWGSVNHPGSEHTVNGKRYQMEMHIVSLKKELAEEKGRQIPDGIAVLGFFIEEADEEETTEAWENLISYLANITKIQTFVNVNHKISISDLLGDVDLNKFYRYNGSLTTPTCNEVVVWTVFKEPIKVSKDLVKKFPETMNYEEIYRPIQNLNGRKVYASPAILSDAGHTWCYHDCEYVPSNWHMLPHSQCGGERQSPISINTKDIIPDPSLKAFILTNFSSPHSIRSIENTGHTVNCVLVENMVEIGGGGLNHQYSALHFHFHWGSSSDSSVGSEHTVNSKRYPMEMHIVNIMKGLTMNEAKMHPQGLAVLGFFIEVVDEEHKELLDHGTGYKAQTKSKEFKMNCWKALRSYLTQIQEKDSAVDVHEPISLDCLLGDVDRTKYYRYNGSLTTPTCDEAVIWTVFTQPITVSRNLVKMFPAETGFNDVYRPQQCLHKRKVYMSAAPTFAAPWLLLLLLNLLYAGWGSI